jgi:hypothetical protein
MWDKPRSGHAQEVAWEPPPSSWCSVFQDQTGVVCMKGTGEEAGESSKIPCCVIITGSRSSSQSGVFSDQRTKSGRGWGAELFHSAHPKQSMPFLAGSDLHLVLFLAVSAAQ